MPHGQQTAFSFWRHCAGCIAVFDLGRRDGLEQAHQSIMLWRQFCTEGHQNCVVIVGNRADKAPRRVQQADAQFFAATMRLLYIETSAKFRTNVIAAVKLAAEIAVDII
jgi:hypothetical protein